ncbi:sporulation protein YtfJ [Bacillus mangrovi]|uniref:Sporulation protein YtfJ n=1 Tax=Metabacillus mangrovi TaxID=1491830 RepID=A0A7X2S404_9BACI|nr:GerW family sporulation protein [Metabacillus mangrovi]MTH52840.1 sporulation protein YtfJ [Metabacillus mangrovi]
MSDHPIQGLMKTAMENLKQMVDVNTIIGDPVETPDGSVILTVSKVGFGFAAGGSEFGQNPGEDQSFSQPQAGHVSGGSSARSRMPFGGGSGGGVSITPIAFLIVGHNGVKMLHLDESTHLYERILDSAPQTVEKIQKMFKKNDQHQNNQSSMRDDIDF